MLNYVQLSYLASISLNGSSFQCAKAIASVNTYKYDDNRNKSVASCSFIFLIKIIYDVISSSYKTGKLMAANLNIVSVLYAGVDLLQSNRFQLQSILLKKVLQLFNMDTPKTVRVMTPLLQSEDIARINNHGFLVFAAIKILSRRRKVEQVLILKA